MKVPPADEEVIRKAVKDLAIGVAEALGYALFCFVLLVLFIAVLTGAIA